MPNNGGRSALPGQVVARLVAAVAAGLANQHPTVTVTDVHAVVYQAATELASTVADPERLRRLLTRRAHARLLAQSGVPVPITRGRRGAGP